MAILRKIYPLLLATLLTSCEEVFTPDLPHTPVLCVNALITAGQAIDAKVTKSRLYTDTSPSATAVHDASVDIYANGQLQQGVYIPREDDEIKIVVQSPTLGHASAEVSVPHAVPALEVEWMPSDVETKSYSFGNQPDNNRMYDISFNLNVRLTLSDPPGDTFYRLAYGHDVSAEGALDDDDWSVSGRYGLTVGDLLYDLEPIFSEHIGIFDSFMGASSYGVTFFTDRQFSGKTYTLNLQFDNCAYVGLDSYMPEAELSLNLYSISQSYYNWVNYLWQRDDGTLSGLGDYGFGDPIWGYSNVTSGAGVVAAQAPTVCAIDLTEFIKNEIARHKEQE